MRHTVATELRELGLDRRTIADLPAQKSEAASDARIGTVDLGRKLHGAVQKLDRANTTNTKLSTHGA